MEVLKKLYDNITKSQLISDDAKTIVAAFIVNEVEYLDQNPISGVEMINIERDRQINELGYDYTNDCLYANNQLSDAAICYAMTPDTRDFENEEGASLNLAIWPWDDKYWKPAPEDRVRELVKAGALIAAQIDYELSKVSSDQKPQP